MSGEKVRAVVYSNNVYFMDDKNQKLYSAPIRNEWKGRPFEEIAELAAITKGYIVTSVTKGGPR